jgi:cell division protein FtsZ
MNNDIMSMSEVITLANIKVVGVGGGGCNAINRMMQAEIRGIEFISVNTDAQALGRIDADQAIHIGDKLTKGLGAGGNSTIGQRAAEETSDQIYDALKDSDMVFITCGMGGGTGTGAAPIVAQIAKEIGALTVSVVTKPFSFEGSHRRANAEEGIANLHDKVDALIVIPNDRLLQVVEKKTSMDQAFRVVDDILHQGIQGIAELITVPGLINLDFADVRTIMSGAGSALMAIGRGEGDERATDAARAAVASPLLEVSIAGAKGVLINVTGGPDLTLLEVTQAADVIVQAADPDARVIFGAVIDPRMQGEVKITVIATGFDGRASTPHDFLKQSVETRASSTAALPAPSVPADDLDIPAFLRRR